MKFHVVGGPLAFTISLEAKDTDSFTSIFKKVQQAAGNGTALDAYDLYTATRSPLTGELVAASGPLRPTDTPATLHLDCKQSDPHLLLLVRKGVGNDRGSMQNSLLYSTTAVGDAGSQGSAATASTSPSPMCTPRTTEEYRRRMRAMYLKYDPRQLHKVEEALHLYRGYEEDVLQQLVKRYGPEPASEDVDPLRLRPTVVPTCDADVHEGVPALSALAKEGTPRNQPSYYDRLVAIYSTYEPEKLSKVDGTLRRYAGREEEVIQQLVKKYGPEISTERVAAEKASAAISELPVPASHALLQEWSASASDVEASPHASTTSPAVKEQAAEVVWTASEVKEGAASPITTTVTPVKATLPAAPAVVSAGDAFVEGVQSLNTGQHPPATAASSLADSLPRHAAASTAVTPSNRASAANSMAISGSYRERLVALYHAYNPAKLHTVEGTLKKFSGKEEVAIQQLVRRYGPEPAPLTSQETSRLLTTASTGGVSRASPSVGPTTENVPGDATSSTRDTTPAPPAEQRCEEPGNSRQQILGILAAYEPDKVDRLDRILDAYKGREGEVISKLEMRYAAQRVKNSAGEPTVRRVGASADAGSSAPVMFTAPPSAAPSVGHQFPSITTAPAEPVSLPAPASPSAAAQVLAHGAPPKTSTTATSHPSSLAPTAPPSHWNSPNDRSSPAAPAGVASTAPASSLKSAVALAERPQTARLETAVPAVAGVPQAQQSNTPQGTPLRLRAPPIAALRVAAAHLEGVALTSVRERYWATWRAHHTKRKAAMLLQQKLWVEASSSAAGPYRLNDCVEPGYTVADLAVVVAQEERGGGSTQGRALSSEMQIAARALLASLRHCVESRVIEVQSSEERQLADALLTHWSAPRNLGPVTDSSELAHALHQAAHFIRQIDDLMTVIRTQAGQLHQLKALHRDVLGRMENAQAATQALDRLQAQLDAANDNRRALELKLKRFSAGVTENHADRPPPRRVVSPAEEHKDAQIAKLHQKLAKTRVSLFLSKQAEEKVKVQLEHSCAREARRKHEDHHRYGSSGRYSTPGSAHTQPRSRSARVGDDANASLSNTPQRRYTPVSTPRGAFSYAIAHDTPRRQSTSQIRVNGRAVSSIRRPDAVSAGQDRTNASINSSTPWPSSRYVMPSAEIERGPCPSCLTPLTSCCPEENGPAAEKAAFCFSCHRYFTFGELRTRD
ncbi:conserved hypothetical protein [Leishmania braziliensis MHOM/BR/75/M2904]|uniref:Uncharacterized protein n=2 Tax=Leishmania braziliensis TaxID=5660 RepID=A4HNZ8_LEIBR|nr:conserved hypothetical protein [Leishmania braziliensis MHOM/BR/75/M2904]CAJ2481301.1 unnamed protein product [Leishmania braziliensis]CAM43904.2 conserved hypothetical protein [Leishmania braziliensis MHOM/BR/75/M2904]